MVLCLEATWFDFMDVCREQWTHGCTILASFTPITDKTSPFTFVLDPTGNEYASSG
jgi:hypothetical protein